MSDKFSFTVAGTGDIAGFYLDFFMRRQDRQGVEFAGAWNRTIERGRAFVDKFGGRLYGSLGELLSDHAVDAVVNLTSPLAHAEITSRCLEAGKHVLSEKPLAATLEDCDRLIGTADSNGVVLACAPFILLGDTQRRAAELLRGGEIGEPVSVTAEMYHGRVETWHPAPRQFYTEGGGPLLDVGPYPVSLLLHWFGPVAEVRGMFGTALPERTDLAGNSFQVTVFDHGFALLRFRSGVLGRLAFSYANSNTDHHGLEVQGTAGSLSLPSLTAGRGELRISERDSGKWDRVEGDPGHQEASGVDWSAGIMELAAAVREQREPAIPASLARDTLAVLLAVEQAARSGKSVCPEQ